MKKRILAVLLLCTMLISLAACENNQDVKPGSTTENTNSTAQTSPPTDNTVTPPEETNSEEGIRENGQLPSIEELTEDEKLYLEVELYDKVLQAVIDLDMNILRTYTKSQYLSGFEKINENPEFKEMYQKTIGTYIYLPDSQYLMLKDTRYVFARWHTDMHINNQEIPKNITDITTEQINEIYRNYYKNAPYNGWECERNSLAYSIEDGHVYYDTDLMFHDILDINLSSLIPERGYGNAYAEFVFNDEADNLDGTYSTLQKNQELLKIMYHFDIDKLYEMFGENQDGIMTSLKRKVANVYGDKEKLQKIKSWYLENCEVVVTTSSMHIFYILDNDMEIVKEQFPYTLFTEAELHEIEDLKLCEWMFVSTSDTGFAQLQSDIIDSAKIAGVID